MKSAECMSEYSIGKRVGGKKKFHVVAVVLTEKSSRFFIPGRERKGVSAEV